MNPTVKTLNRAAQYLDRNPEAFAEGAGLATILADQARYFGGDHLCAIELVREAVGMSGVTGALRVWASKHTPAQAAALLRKVAASVAEEVA